METLNIDDKTYKIPEINRYKNQTVKTQIVLASSTRKNGHHITRLQHKDFGKTKKWNTFTVSRSGLIYKHYEPKFHSDFLGIKDADKQSISIVLENMCYLIEVESGKHINWLNEVCNEENVINKHWQGFNYWEQYTEEQMESTLNLCVKLCDEFNIPKMLIDFSNYHKDIVKFKGIVFRSNYINDSSDNNPLFNIENFNNKLQKQLV